MPRHTQPERNRTHRTKPSKKAKSKLHKMGKKK
jgi:hypothetical protein